MFVDEIRRQAEVAPRAAMPAVSAALWKAFAAGQVSEADAETLSEVIEARKALPVAIAAPRKAVGSRPRTDGSMERRRRWAASGRLPPGLAARFTLAEAAVLAVIASETVRRGDCRLVLDHIAAAAGVSRSTAKTALRQARTLGLITIEERRASGWRNLSNVVRVVSAEWIAWNRLARRPYHEGGGVRSSTTTDTRSSKTGNFGDRKPRKGCRGPAGDATKIGRPRIVMPGGSDRAMR